MKTEKRKHLCGIMLHLASIKQQPNKELIRMLPVFFVWLLIVFYQIFILKITDLIHSNGLF
jgi:hypothetical protein